MSSILIVDGASSNETIARARSLREAGQFQQAKTLLTTALKRDGKKLSDVERKQLSYEVDLIERIRQDFSISRKDLYDRLKKAVRNLTEKELDGWIKEGRFESRLIDGELLFAGTSVNNLFWRHRDLTSRDLSSNRKPTRDNSSYYAKLLANCRRIKKAAVEGKSPYAEPVRFHLTLTVTVDAGAVPEGEIIRAWLPIPHIYDYPFQEQFELINYSSPIKYLSDEKSSIRSAYLEQKAEKDKTSIHISFRYKTHGRHFQLKPEESEPLPKDPAVTVFLEESPHAMFSDGVKKLGATIVGSETNAVRKARAIYDWISKNLHYSYSLEYSTIPNITEYTIEKGWADCGQQALTFITLCRSQGIPARWQSGWYLFPGSKNIHDWAEIYLAPWGWVPVDAEFGNAILRYAKGLTNEERKELYDFYFGGLDQYRMAANSDHSQELQPPKKTFRSDDVDFQRGELEWGQQNLYFDKYSYDMQIEYLDAK